MPSDLPIRFLRRSWCSSLCQPAPRLSRRASAIEIDAFAAAVGQWPFIDRPALSDLGISDARAVRAPSVDAAGGAARAQSAAIEFRFQCNAARTRSSLGALGPASRSSRARTPRASVSVGWSLLRIAREPCAPRRTSSAHANRAISTDLPLGHPIPGERRAALCPLPTTASRADLSGPPNLGALLAALHLARHLLSSARPWAIGGVDRAPVRERERPAAH
jgi:hypothetical protein